MDDSNIFDKIHEVDLQKTMLVSSVIQWVNIILMVTALFMER